MIMNTPDYAQITYYLLDGDYRRFDGVYINDGSSIADEIKQKELSDLLWDKETGEYLIEPLESKPSEITEPVYLVECGQY